MFVVTEYSRRGSRFDNEMNNSHPNRERMPPPIISAVPSAYVEGYAIARLSNATVADQYIRHTFIGDPLLDPIMEELADLDPPKMHKFIGAGISGNEDQMRYAPESLRLFFASLEEPDWVNHDDFLPGIRAFFANAGDTMLGFLCGVLVEGFSTLIRKSFVMTGRVQYHPSSKRLKQNIRQFLDIFLPNGLQVYNDGWKLSLRIRFVHSRVRILLNAYDDWDYDAWGTPVSAAHLGFAIAVFSAGMIEYAKRLGVRFTPQEKEGIMNIWRLSGDIMGIPGSILYTNRAEALELRRIAKICEPAPDEDSVTMAHALLSSTTKTGDIEDEKEAAQLKKQVFSLSRALLGKEVADMLNLPPNRLPGTLVGYRIDRKIKKLTHHTRQDELQNFIRFLQASAYDELGISYEMPDHVEFNKSSSW